MIAEIDLPSRRAEICLFDVALLQLDELVRRSESVVLRTELGKF